MLDITHPAVIKFFSENYYKEKKLRLKWFFRNIESIKDSATIKNPNILTETEALVEKFKVEMSDLKVFKRPEKRMIPLCELAKHEKYVFLKPIEPEQKNLLYTSTIGEGRKNYLRKRFKMNPEDKFYFPECSSWVYGWELKKAGRTGGERYPRVQIVRRSFYRDNGVGRDPNQYREPAGTKPTICNS